MSKLETKIKLAVDLAGIEGLVLKAAQEQYPAVALNEENTIVTLRATRTGTGIAADIEFFPVLVPEDKKALTVAGKAGVATTEEAPEAEAKTKEEAVAESSDDALFDA